jgi:hypothetical protein
LSTGGLKEISTSASCSSCCTLCHGFTHLLSWIHTIDKLYTH